MTMYHHRWTGDHESPLSDGAVLALAAAMPVGVLLAFLIVGVIKLIELFGG